MSRKTKDEYHIMVNYGHGDGWEHETTEFSRKAAIKCVQLYKDDCDYPVKFVKKRVPI